MSRKGHYRRFGHFGPMSALLPIADLTADIRLVRDVPGTDLSGHLRAAQSGFQQKCIEMSVRASSLLLGRQRAHPRNEVVNVGIGHVGIVGKAHWRIEFVSVFIDALGDRTFDLRVAPCPDSFCLA